MAQQDNRILHVSSKYKNLQGMDVATKLDNIHDTLYKEFSAVAKGKGIKGSGSAKEAKELQNFMALVKRTSKDSSYANNIKDQMIRQVIESVVSLSMKTARTGTQSLFYYVAKDRKKIWEQGDIFERQLSAVVASTIGMAAGHSKAQVKRSASAVNLGKESATMIDSVAKELIQNAAEQIDKEIDKNNKATFSKYVTVEKDAKIDISGLRYQCTLSAEPSSYLYKIASLLQQANFTAKSYRSQTVFWDRKIKEYVTKKTEKATLHLGHSEAARSLLTVLGANNIAAPVALSMYYYIMNTSDENVKKKAANLRFIYELTGYGQHYKNDAIQNLFGSEFRANYIIYNDPASDDIFVRSTADIIIELWDKLSTEIDRRAVELEKKMFH